MTLRTRLIAVSMLTLAIGLGALLLVGNVLLAVRANNQTDSLLQARADAQIAALNVTKSGITVRDVANDAALDREAWVFSGLQVVERPTGAAPELDAAAARLARGGVATTKDGPNDSRLLARPVSAPEAGAVRGMVVVGTSTEALEDLRQEVLIGSLALAVLVLIGGGLATRAAVDGALARVADMTERAESWSAHDLDQRFGQGPPRDELTGLAATLDHMLARIAASRRHEQRFAADVAHELRTPLTALRGRAELAVGAESAEQDAALRDVVSSAERLDATIDTLLNVARAEINPASGSVDLAAVAAEISDVTLLPPPPGLPPAEGDAEIVRRALAPLIENARRYARSTVTLECVAADGTVSIMVRDDGPGLGAEPDAHGAHDGAGLGLPLARRLAQACGGDVITHPDGPGGVFELRLPAV